MYLGGSENPNSSCKSVVCEDKGQARGGEEGRSRSSSPKRDANIVRVGRES